MGLLSSLIGLGIGAAAIKGAADSHDARKGWMKSTEKKQFDEINAREGIQTNQVVNIARRCKIKTNKFGVLPKEGYLHCLQYVRRYANSEDDIKTFVENWEKTWEQQVNNMPTMIKNSKYAKEYVSSAKILRDYKADRPLVTPVTYEIMHWRNIPKAEHLKRMQEIATKTALKHVLYQPPILRWNDMVCDMYTEFWTVYADPNDSIGILSKRYFKHTYTKCAAHLGYDAELL